MTGWELFKIRFIDDLRYQRKVLGTVMDWIIALYTIVPILIIASILYVDVWRNVTSYWIEPLPYSILPGLLLLLAIGGKFRPFMLEADQLFLLDQPRLYRSLRQTTFWYSCVQIVSTTAFLLILFLPWFIQLVGLGWGENFSIFIFTLSFRMVQATWKRINHHVIKRVWMSLFLYVIGVLMFIYLPLSVLGIVGSVSIMLLSFWHLLSLAPSKSYFFQEVNEENKERMRYAKFVLGIATNVEKTPIRFGKRPILWRRSRRIFKRPSPGDGLLELLIKGLLRHSVYLRSYLQLIAITMSAVIILPLWLKWIVFLLFISFMNYNSWLRGLYEKMLDQHFFQCIPIKKEVREEVWIRFKRLLMYPAVGFIGMLTAIFTIISL